MIRNILLLILMCSSVLVYGQARLQVIHNSPSPTVDIWVNGDPFETDFAFREATDFRTVPSGVLLNVGVAPAPSNSVNDTIVNFPVVLEADQTYVVVATGIVGDQDNPFSLAIFDQGQELGMNNNADVLVYHGSTDAPAVDVYARDVGLLVNNIAYGAFQGYLSVPPDEYILDVTPTGVEDEIVASFAAPLTDLDGGAAVVFASGFLNPADTSAPGFGLFAALSDGSVLELPAVENTARLQVIHNAPTPTVDIWLDGELFLSDFEYQTATPFIDAPAGRTLDIGIAPSPSDTITDIIANFPVNLDIDSTYVVMATGIVGDTSTPFVLAPFIGGQEEAEADGVDLLIYHGSTDAPGVDVFARDVAQLVDGLTYGSYTDGYLNVPAGAYTLDITPDGDNDQIVASFAADVSGLDSAAAVVFASGFLAPADTTAPSFGLYVALPDGTVLPLDQVMNTARLQVIHNSPTPTVDIWLDGELFLPNFEYQTATPFIDAPAGRTLEIGIAPSPSDTVTDIIANFPVNLDIDSTYVVVATGIVGDPTTPFTLAPFIGGQEAAEGDGVDLLIYHGSTDAPGVDVFARDVAQLVDGLTYGNYSDGYLNVPADAYTLDITPDNDNDQVVASFDADVSGLDGGAAVVFASGFLAPADTTDPGFGLLVALPDGTVLPLEQVTNTARLQVIHNSPTPTVDIWLDGELFLPDFEFQTATPFIDAPAGRTLEIGIAPSPSDTVTDIIATFPVVLAPDESYVAVATGIVGDATTPFDLAVFEGAREAADDTGVDLLVYHGSTDAPAVDVTARNVAQLVDGLAYGSFESEYINVPADDYILDISPDMDSTQVVASFAADVSGLDGGAAVVFASGFLAPADTTDPAFGLLVALPDGTVVPLEQVATTARLQVIHNSPTPTVDIWLDGELFLPNFEFQTATPFIDAPAGRTLEIGIAPSPSDTITDIIATFPVNLLAGETYVAVATGIVDDPTTPFNLALFDGGREAADGGSGVDVLVYHGSTDAPAVDVFARNVAQLVDGLAYGSFEDDYLNVPAGSYILDVTPDMDNDQVVASFAADVSILDGGAAVVFASGFLTPEDDDDPAFGLYAALANGLVIPLPQVENSARLQVIHNSPSPTVDIWLDGELFLPDFEFQTATPFIDAPAGRTLEIGIAPSPSDTVTDIIATFPVVLAPDETYVAVATGIVGDATTPFDLAIFEGAREAADDTGVDLLVYHGSTNAPAVNVEARDVALLVENLAYGSFSTDYLNVPAEEYILDIAPNAAPEEIVASFRADLRDLEGGAGVVFASGLLGDDPAFGLFAALPDGQVLPLMQAENTARVQIVHNSPSPTVDIWINGAPFRQDFEYRTATPFFDAPAGQTLEIGVAPSPSDTITDVIATFDVYFEIDESYVIFANGVVGDADQPFTLVPFEGAREVAQAGQDVDLLVFHGSNDAPTVDIFARQVGRLIDDLEFGTFATDGYITVPDNSYTLDVALADDSSTVAGSFTADLTGTNGSAITVFASGYLNPSGDQPAFGLFAVFADGTIIELPLITSTRDIDPTISDFRLYPNPAIEEINIEFESQKSVPERITVYNNQGVLVLNQFLQNQAVGNQKFTLNVDGWSNGVYVVQVLTNRGYVSKYFLIQR